MARIPFGKKHGKFYSAREVKNGLACHCFCPECNGPLVARNNGQIMRPHFAHQAKSGCSGATESSLHLAAKSIFAAPRRMTIPGASLNWPSGSSWLLHNAKELSVLPLGQEVPLGPYRCDALVGTPLGSIYVEICVTHAVDPVKAAYCQKNGYSVIEIRLGHLIDKFPSMKQLYFEVLSGKNAHWISSSHVEEMRTRSIHHASKITSGFWGGLLRPSACPGGDDPLVSSAFFNPCRNCRFCIAADSGSVRCAYAAKEVVGSYLSEIDRAVA